MRLKRPRAPVAGLAAPPPRSVFARVLAAQLITVAGVVVLLSVLFYIERNLTVARLIAERWGPTLLQAAGQPLAADAPTHTLLQHTGTEPPPGAEEVPGRAPRMATLLDALDAQGLMVQRLAVQPGRPVTLWLRVAGPAGGEPLWLGFAEPLVESRLPLRVGLAAGLGLLLVASVSGWLAYRLVRPLEALRVQLAGHRPGGTALPPAPGPQAGSAEIAAVGDAWREMQARLALHERERALMLAGVSHDLRSPLARIRLAAALLPDTPEVADRRESIDRNVAVADRLLQGFLDHAQVGELALDQTVDLAALLQRVARQWRESAAPAAGSAEADSEPGDARLQTDWPAALALPQAHPLLVERLVLNLLDNARQHGRPPWALRAGLAPEGTPREVWIEVQDAGEGIPPGERSLVQQAFYRGDASRSRPGSGLGLAVVRDGVARLGGRIEFAHEAPGRHVVRLCLPLPG